MLNWIDMLILKPNCEACNCDLPASSDKAYICSYECTFCESCVENLLSNVCPNCGGGFTLRPIRPTNEYRQSVGLKFHPSSSQRVNTKYTTEQITDFINQIKETPAAER